VNIVVHHEKLPPCPAPGRCMERPNSGIFDYIQISPGFSFKQLLCFLCKITSTAQMKSFRHVFRQCNAITPIKQRLNRQCH
jgi:hypothetical protein